MLIVYSKGVLEGKIRFDWLWWMC